MESAESGATPEWRAEQAGASAQPGEAEHSEYTVESSFASDEKAFGSSGQALREDPGVRDNVKKAGRQPDKVTPRSLLSANSLAEPTFLSRLYNVLACAPLLTLSLIYIAQTFFLIDTRELWYSDEVRHADVLRYMIENKDWFVPHLNGEFYPDKPPLYFWFLTGIYQFILFFDAEISPLIFSNTGLKIILAHEGRLIQQVMSLGAVISGLFFIWASYAFSRMTARFDKRLAFAVGLVLLGSLYFMAATHYARMDLLFAAFIVVSQIFFFAAVQRQSAMPLMLGAFFFMALACLCKGPLGAFFPLVTVVLYLIWQGRPRRLLSRDMLAGLILALVMVGLWIFALLDDQRNLEDIYAQIIDRQIIQRTVDAWHHSRPWYDYLWMLPLIWMPFVFVLPLAPWSQALNPVKVFRTLREPRYQGLCYAWIYFLAGFAGLSLVSTKIHIYLLPLFAPLAVLTAQAIMSLPESRSRCFKIILAIFATILIPVFAAPLVLPMFMDVNIRILGTVIAAAISLVFAALFWGGINGRRPEGSLLTWAVFCCALMQPLGLVTAPSLDAFLSPKAQAEIINKYKQDGYQPIAYRVYPGVYSFYTNGKIEEVSGKPRLEELLRSQDKLIMAIRLKDWEKMDQQAYPELVEINRQRLAEQEAILLVINAPAVAPSGTSGETPGQGLEGTVPGASAPAPEALSAPAADTPDGKAQDAGARESGAVEGTSDSEGSGESTGGAPVPAPVRDQATEAEQKTTTVPAPERVLEPAPGAELDEKPQMTPGDIPDGSNKEKPGSQPDVPGNVPDNAPGQPDLPIHEVTPDKPGNIAVSPGGGV